MAKQQFLPRQCPQVSLARPAPERMWMVAFCALAAVVQSSLTDSFASLVLALSALASSCAAELLITRRERGFDSLKDGSAAASALVLVLLLPNRIHPLYAVLAAVFAIVVVKHSFGGLGSNWANPAAAGWLFLRVSWPDAFDSALRGSPLSVISEGLASGLSSPQGSPLGILKIAGSGGGWAASRLDGVISSALNGSVFSFLGAEIPSGYVDLFVSGSPGIIADRGLACLLAGTIAVAAFQAVRVWVPAVYLLVYAVLVRIAGGIPFGGAAGSGDILFGVFSGGIIAAAFLLACEPVTGAKSGAGIFAGAVTAGFLSWFFRYQGLDHYGAFLAVLAVNAVSVFIRGVEFRCLYAGGRAPAGKGLFR
ncbi:MAG: RnfABCDGE type electron transport complex subunit D [Treponema sp.]|jgi:electron transport complex protein RnfD|nr:RnfABCDGE type electron transport complex subunit D [Treponema sp.]